VEVGEIKQTTTRKELAEALILEEEEEEVELHLVELLMVAQESLSSNIPTLAPYPIPVEV
jgi:hypothetical protein